MEARATVHPLADLSAYLDGALGQDERVSVESHLAGCAACRSRLAELAGTARLIAALPDPVPARRLVPRVAIPFWIAPLRTAAALASGSALFLFLASAMLANLPLTQTGSAPAAAPAPAPLRTSASAAPQLGAGGAFGPATPAPSGVERSVLQSDAAKGRESATPPTVRQEAPSPVPERLSAFAAQRQEAGLSPWLWLGLAAAFGGLALILQRRLRAR